MKKLILALVLAPTLALAAPCPFTPSAAVDAEVTAVFSRIKALQDVQKTGLSIDPRYLQLLAPLASKTGTERAPHGQRVPSGSRATVEEFGFLFSDTLFAAYKVHEHRGPEGDGYSLRAILTRGDIRCRATAKIGSGPASFPFPLGSRVTWHEILVP